jgi:DNA-binding PadR family transcriptional regulator
VSLRFAALGLLAQHPGSGYDLLRRFEQSMANVWPATQSQLYGELNKLATDGLIEVGDIGPRGRKEYRVTDAGRAELVRWVTDPQDDPPHRSAALLRVFLLGEVPPAQAREYLLGIAAHADSELNRLRELRESLAPWGESAAEFYGGAALEYGLGVAEMEGTWARSQVRALDDRQAERKKS